MKLIRLIRFSPLFCKIKHAWLEDYNYTKYPKEKPSPYTFYKQHPQPDLFRTCKRCKKEEVSKEDQFGNTWWVPPAEAQYQR